MKLAPINLKQWQNLSRCVITLERDRILVEIVRLQQNRLNVLQSWELPFSTEEAAENPQKVGLELAKSLQTRRIRERRAMICLPLHWAQFTPILLPEAATDDLLSYLELQADRKFSIPSSELKLTQSSYVLPNGKKEAILAAIPLKKLTAVQIMLKAGGCSVSSISLGLDSFQNQSIPSKSGLLHLIFNGDQIDLISTNPSGILGIRSLSPRSNPQAPGFDLAWLYQEIRMTLGRLPEGSASEIREARWINAPATFESAAKEISELLRKAGIQKSIFSKSQGQEPLKSTTTTETGSLTTAELHLKNQPVLFEFFSPQTQPYEKALRWLAPKRNRSILWGVIAFVLLPTIAFVYQAQTESSLESEWKSIKPAVAEVEILQNKIRQFRPWFEATPKSLQMMNGIIALFPETGDVYAKTLEIHENSKIVCSGFAKKQPALQEFLDRLQKCPQVTQLQTQQVRGNNPIQFSCTFIWKVSHEN